MVQEMTTKQNFSAKQLEIIKRTVAPDTNIDEFNLFIETAKTHGLNPFTGQIKAVIFNKNKPDKRQMATIVTIDGYRVKAEKTDRYRPDENPPVFDVDQNLKTDKNPAGIISCTIKVHKQDTKGNWYPIAATVYWDEFAPIQSWWKDSVKQEKLSDNWQRMPRHMLAKCAEAQALRRAFPESYSNLYAEEEMHKPIAEEMTAAEAVEAYQSEQRQRALGYNKTVPFQWAAGEPLEYVPLGNVVDRVTEFLSKVESPTQLKVFSNINQISLRDFWAQRKTDALEVKRMIEEKQKALENDGQESLLAAD